MTTNNQILLLDTDHQNQVFFVFLQIKIYVDSEKIYGHKLVFVLPINISEYETKQNK